MHCELAVPGLLRAQSPERLPALELLLARGRKASAEGAALERWLMARFEAEAHGLPAGALTLLAGGEDPRDALWARADPAHLQLMRDRAVIVPGEAFPLSRAEADALCASVNAGLSGRLELRAIEPQRWCARLAESATSPLEPAWPAEPALEHAGRAVGAMAREAKGGDALLTEIQMLLHEHPVNEAREARGEPPVNSLWLWGAGRAPRQARSPWKSIAAAEPVALGLARLAGARALQLPASAAVWLETAPSDGRHLFVLDALRAPLALADEDALARRLRELERDWFAPLLAALREGRIGMATIHVPEPASAVSFETVRGDLRRFWRRPRPASSWAAEER